MRASFAVASISSSLLAKYRYTALVDMPLAATTSSIDVGVEAGLGEAGPGAGQYVSPTLGEEVGSDPGHTDTLRTAGAGARRPGPVPAAAAHGWSSWWARSGLGIGGAPVRADGRLDVDPEHLVVGPVLGPTGVAVVAKSTQARRMRAPIWPGGVSPTRPVRAPGGVQGVEDERQPPTRGRRPTAPAAAGDGQRKSKL